MRSLEAELEDARALDVATLADAIETIGFECTQCGACCRADETSVEGEKGTTEGSGNPNIPDREPHTATLFPDEVRELQAVTGRDWRDVARPMPFGLREGTDGTPEGETFEWALATTDCGDCAFYAEDAEGPGACTVHPHRPLICRTYPFSLALGGTSQPMGGVVEHEGVVRAHECEGLGRDISPTGATDLARTLKDRAIRELTEAIGVRDGYRPTDPGPGAVVVHDSEGPKQPDGTPLD